MLTIEKFEEYLNKPCHPDRLYVAVDSNDNSKLYILANGGIANLNCNPIEHYAAEIKVCALEMIVLGRLYLKPNEKILRIGEGHSVYSYTLKLDESSPQANSAGRQTYFSSSFIRWQITHQLSDEVAQEKLGLTANDFQLFRDDELTITQDLINKLAEATGASKQFWQNRWLQQTRSHGRLVNRGNYAFC